MTFIFLVVAWSEVAVCFLYIKNIYIYLFLIRLIWLFLLKSWDLFFIQFYYWDFNQYRYKLLDWLRWLLTIPSHPGNIIEYICILCTQHVYKKYQQNKLMIRTQGIIIVRQFCIVCARPVVDIVPSH